MTSFLSDKNINKLQYQLRQVYPENKWVAIMSSVRDAARIWFYQHTDTLQLIYQRDGLEGLNKKFISDMMASAEYFEHTNEPSYRQDQLFDTDITDPNIQADQPMPYVTGIENPMFTFATFSKGWGADGQPESGYIYKQKPSYGPDNPMSHTLQGPGPRRGPIKHYSDTDLLIPTNGTAYNITDRLTQTKLGFDCDGCNTAPRPYVPPPPKYNSQVNYAPTRTAAAAYNAANYQNRRMSDSRKSEDGFIKRLTQGLTQFKKGFTSREDAMAATNNNIVSHYDSQLGANSKYQPTQGAAATDYGTQMSRGIYNSQQPKFMPNAFEGYELGKMVDSYDSDSGKYIPYPNNESSNVMKTINQMQFGDIPVATEMSNSELAVLGHQLYRQKGRPKKKQRPPQVDGCGIPRREYLELFDDYPTNQVRAKFHLDQIYNTPESRINTVMDPVMGKSAMWNSQERSVLDIPCSSIATVPPANAANRYNTGHQYADGYADSYGVSGCRLCNSEPRRDPYPTRDFIPPRYTTSYERI